MKDSPVFELLNWATVPDIAHVKTDVFRKRAEYNAKRKAELASARKAQNAAEKLGEIEQSLGPLHDVEAGVVIDLFLSYRGVKAWDQMVDLTARMDPALRETVLVREQLALALNRLERRDEAEDVLTTLIKQRGPSSETYGILGRVYKDRWDDATRAGQTLVARALLDKAIETYLRGFEADQRDAYPGVNAITLMELREPPDPRREKITPIVRYAVERKIANGSPDYWDYATLVELAVLAKDEDNAMASLGLALAEVREPLEPETTARNLRLIREVRTRRGEFVPWHEEVEAQLNRASGV